MTGRAPLVVVGNPENRRVTLFRAAAEVNAFGDLLPGLSDPAGRDSYAAELHALRTGRFDRWRAAAPNLLESLADPESTTGLGTAAEPASAVAVAVAVVAAAPTAAVESMPDPESTVRLGTAVASASTVAAESTAGPARWGPQRAGDAGTGRHENPGRDRKVGRAA
ncbi:hypothetical protein GCM10022225_57540 [Plantactinospora mayteni]|uniref:Uncharacterized protein n=1 Tax=Plantactinospora mayteni TaxID=566021 RepID=A0ABQ4F1Q0_9ACTN|nr:hypothetical protein [Plantactinospora mayteni]GIH00841.1 hypothetical protein Pma05_74130 [Plantactinospora mayteni]